MTVSAPFILMLISLVCFLCAAIGRPQTPPPLSLGWLGLFFYVLAVMVGGLSH